jgi:hypothetical protein
MTNKIQHSIKVGDAILVLGGDTWSEFGSTYIEVYGQDAYEHLVDAFTRAVGGVDVMGQAVANVQNGGLTGVNPGLTNNTQWQPQARAQDQAPAVMCAHGAMVHRSGTKGNKPWSGYFCPQPKGAPDQCPPQWG